MLTGHAAIRNRQPPRDPTVALLGQMLLLDALTEQDGASQDVMRHACDVVRPSRLSLCRHARRRRKTEEGLRVLEV